MTELELKARAYELIVMIENCRAELTKINEELASRETSSKET